MQLLVGTIYAWVAVYALVGAYFTLLGGTRRVDRNYLVFGVLCAFQALFAYASSRGFQAQTVADVIRWGTLRGVLGITVLALFIHFQLRVSLPESVSRRWVRAPLFLLLLAPVFGWTMSGTTAAQTYVHTGTFLGEPIVFRAIAYRPVLDVFFIPMGIGTTAAFIAAVYSIVRGRGAQRVLSAASLLVIGAASYDGLIWTTQARGIYLVEHVYCVYAFMVSYVLTARLSEELSSRDVELARLSVALRSLRASLEQKEQLAAVGELSAIVAHEVRNPLSVITNAVASLRKPELRAAERELLHGILSEESTRLNRIVTELLVLARPIEPQQRAVDLDELIDRALAPARGADTLTHVTFAEGTRHEIVADAHLLRQALENLIDNAVQAMGIGGELTVAVTPREREGRSGREIAVIDTGEGMNTEVRARAKDPFFTTRSSGTGLGLAIVDRIVRAHGGSMEIHSARSKGTTVRVWLPDGVD